jgi:hypothetical protein
VRKLNILIGSLALLGILGSAHTSNAENGWTVREHRANENYFSCLSAAQESGIPVGTNRAAERCAASAENVIAACYADDGDANCDELPGMMRGFFAGRMRQRLI